LAQVRLGDVERMLDECAPGHEVVPKLHRYWVKYRGKTYRAIPKGPGQATQDRAKRGRVQIQLSKVKAMVAHLGISEDCARKYFPDLKLPVVPRDNL